MRRRKTSFTENVRLRRKAGAETGAIVTTRNDKHFILKLSSLNTLTQTADNLRDSRVMQQRQLAYLDSAILEKIFADYFAAYARTAEVSIKLIESQLAKQMVVLSYQTGRFDSAFNSRLESAQVNKNQYLVFCSSFVEGYQDIGSLTVLDEISGENIHFMEYVRQYRRPPEQAYHQGRLISIHGLIPICALAKLTNHYDFLGGEGGNVGVVYNANQQCYEAVIIDYLTNTFFEAQENRCEQDGVTEQDIRYSMTQEDGREQESYFQFLFDPKTHTGFTPAQQQAFIQTMHRAISKSPNYIRPAKKQLIELRQVQLLSNDNTALITQYFDQRTEQCVNYYSQALAEIKQTQASTSSVDSLPRQSETAGEEQFILLSTRNTASLAEAQLTYANHVKPQLEKFKALRRDIKRYLRERFKLDNQASIPQFGDVNLQAKFWRSKDIYTAYLFYRLLDMLYLDHDYIGQDRMAAISAALQSLHQQHHQTVARWSHWLKPNRLDTVLSTHIHALPNSDAKFSIGSAKYLTDIEKGMKKTMQRHMPWYRKISRQNLPTTRDRWPNIEKAIEEKIVLYYTKLSQEDANANEDYASRSIKSQLFDFIERLEQRYHLRLKQSRGVMRRLSYDPNLFTVRNRLDQLQQYKQQIEQLTEIMVTHQRVKIATIDYAKQSPQQSILDAEQISAALNQYRQKLLVDYSQTLQQQPFIAYDKLVNDFHGLQSLVKHLETNIDEIEQVELALAQLNQQTVDCNLAVNDKPMASHEKQKEKVADDNVITMSFD